MILVQIVVFLLFGIVMAMGLDELSKKFDFATLVFVIILAAVEVYFGLSILDTLL